MKNIVFFIYLLIICFTFISCEKKNDTSTIKGTVDLYLIDSYETKPNSYQIIHSTVITKGTPLISYADILGYSPSKHTFTLTNEAIQIIKNLEHSVYGLPFAIKAHDELVYTGYFWPGYSSAGCDWVVIDPIFVEMKNTAKVRLGYPGLTEGMTIPDNRNDDRIIEIFRRDGKLID